MIASLMLCVIGATASEVTEAMKILRQECVICHSPEKKKGGLILDSRESILRGGSSGSLVETNKPGSSLLLKVLEKDSDPHMPPKKQLDPRQIRTLRHWLMSGFGWDQRTFDDEEVPREVVLGTLPDGYHPVQAIAVSPSNLRLAAGRGRNVLIFDISGTNFSLIRERPVASDAVHSLAWSQDERSLIVGDFRRLHVLNSDLAQNLQTAQ